MLRVDAFRHRHVQADRQETVVAAIDVFRRAADQAEQGFRIPRWPRQRDRLPHDLFVRATKLPLPPPRPAPPAMQLDDHALDELFDNHPDRLPRIYRPLELHPRLDRRMPRQRYERLRGPPECLV